MNRLTLAIVADTLFGAQVGSQSDTARVQQAITDVMEMFDLVMLPFAEWLVHLPLPRMRRYRAARQALDALIYGIIASRGGRSGEDRGDLLSMLLHAQDDEGSGGMSDRQLRDEVMTLFLAGHETTAQRADLDVVAAGARTPTSRRTCTPSSTRVLDGRAPTADDVAAPAATRARSSPRSMRLYPPAWTIGPRACCATTAGTGTTSRAGVADPDEPVGHAPRSAVLARPEALRSRALARRAARERPRFAYFPFGGGPRVHRRQLRLERSHPGARDASPSAGASTLDPRIRSSRSR